MQGLSWLRYWKKSDPGGRKNCVSERDNHKRRLITLVYLRRTESFNNSITSFCSLQPHTFLSSHWNLFICIPKKKDKTRVYHFHKIKIGKRKTDFVHASACLIHYNKFELIFYQKRKKEKKLNFAILGVK